MNYRLFQAIPIVGALAIAGLVGYAAGVLAIEIQDRIGRVPR